MSARTDRTIDAGKLRFHAHYRSGDSDYGPAVEVFAETAPGNWKEVLRFDCFAHEPHRHYFRSDGVEDRQGYTGGIAESVAAAKGELAGVTALLARIGYADLVRDLSTPQVNDAVAEVERELTTLAARPR
jgi:hypothetical protein